MVSHVSWLQWSLLWSWTSPCSQDVIRCLCCVSAEVRIYQQKHDTLSFLRKCALGRRARSRAESRGACPNPSCFNYPSSEQRCIIYITGGLYQECGLGKINLIIDHADVIWCCFNEWPFKQPLCRSRGFTLSCEHLRITPLSPFRLRCLWRGASELTLQRDEEKLTSVRTPLKTCAPLTLIWPLSHIKDF